MEADGHRGRGQSQPRSGCEPLARPPVTHVASRASRLPSKFKGAGRSPEPPLPQVLQLPAWKHKFAPEPHPGPCLQGPLTAWRPWLTFSLLPEPAFRCLLHSSSTALTVSEPEGAQEWEDTGPQGREVAPSSGPRAGTQQHPEGLGGQEGAFPAQGRAVHATGTACTWVEGTAWLAHRAGSGWGQQRRWDGRGAPRSGALTLGA